MKEVDEKFFCREIKYAHIICNPDYGYLVSIHQNNPYQRLKFHPPENSRFFFWENKWGTVLKLVQNNETKLFAIRMLGHIEGGRFEDETENEKHKTDCKRRVQNF